MAGATCSNISPWLLMINALKVVLFFSSGVSDIFTCSPKRTNSEYLLLSFNMKRSFPVKRSTSPGNLSGIHKQHWASFSAFVLTPAIKCGCKFENPSTSQFTVYIHTYIHTLHDTLYRSFGLLPLGWYWLKWLRDIVSMFHYPSLRNSYEFYNAFTNVGLTLRFIFPLRPSSPLSPNPSCHCALKWVHRR